MASKTLHNTTQFVLVFFLFWFGLVLHGMVWFVLVCFFCGGLVFFVMVWFGLVWFVATKGMTRNQLCSD